MQLNLLIHQALHWAVKGDNVNGVQYLIEHGADQNLKCNDGRIPVEFATSQKMKEFFGNEDVKIEIINKSSNV